MVVNAEFRSRLLEKVGFGGGCHWCTEGVFQALRGVDHVDQGYIQSESPADTWSEGVTVRFNPSIISLTTLSEVHLRTHSAGRARTLRSKYRSAIYVVEASQRREAESAVAQFVAESGMTVQTRVLQLVSFKPSETHYQNYYRTDPNRPFCRRYIDPKLDYIRQHFAAISITAADKATP
jgi:peptide-methionine (S)-S-oxide reductase